MSRNPRHRADNAGLTLFAYGKAMNGPQTTSPDEPVEQALRDELARGDALVAGARPILRHLLAEHDRALFSEELVARVRGMMLDLARQLLFAEAEAANAPDRAAYVAERQDTLAAALSDEDLLGHAQARVVEARLAERLQAQAGIDPVLSPLIQNLAADANEAVAGEAMTVLAAQARFMQHHRRMELPLRELPGELLHMALLVLREQSDDPEVAEIAERRVRHDFDESSGREAALARLAMAAHRPAAQMLDIAQAGVAVFATGLALASGQSRDRTVLSFTARQQARLALALRAAGLDRSQVDAQLLVIDPDASPPGEVAAMPVGRAAAVLATAATTEEAANG